MNETKKGKKKGMRYFYLSLLVGLLTLSSVKAADSVFMTNSVNGAGTTNAFVLLTNRAIIHDITITGGANALTVKLFDEDRNSAPWWGTNFVTSNYTAVLSYPTNITSTNISETGITNIFTNSYTYTYTSSIAAVTNAMTPILALAAPANQSATLSGLSVLGVRGITAQCSTNATIIFRYSSGN